MIEIRQPDRAAMEAAAARWNRIAKPLHSLGVLEEDIPKLPQLLQDWLGQNGLPVVQQRFESQLPVRTFFGHRAAEENG